MNNNFFVSNQTQPHTFYYPGSQNMKRADEGIKHFYGPLSSQTFWGHFAGIVNYPTLAKISKIAAQKIDVEWQQNGNPPTIKIFAHLKLGQEFAVFSIDNNFFGRVQRTSRNSTEPYLKYETGTFPYDSHEESFENDEDCDRSIPGGYALNKPITDDEAITHFSAKYYLGYVSASEIHNFTLRFFKQNDLPEQLILDMDTDEQNNWKLTLFQRESTSHPAVPQEIIEDNSMVIDAKKKIIAAEAAIAPKEKAIPENFICPITEEIMKDPVITPTGYTYERDAIIAWLVKDPSCPMTRQELRAEQLIPNRALKNAIETFLKESKL